MRRSILAAILCSVFVCCGKNEKENNEEAITGKEVREFIESYDKIWYNRDTNSMKEMMDEGYIYFTSAGSSIDRGHILSWFAPADKYKVVTAARNEISFSLKGNTAIVSSRWTGSGSFGEEKFNDDQRCSLVLQKHNGKVRIIAEHCTEIAK